MTGLPLDSQAQPIVVLPCPLLPQRLLRPLSHWAGAENLSGQEQTLSVFDVDVALDVVDVDVVDVDVDVVHVDIDVDVVAVAVDLVDVDVDAVDVDVTFCR